MTCFKQPLRLFRAIAVCILAALFCRTAVAQPQTITFQPDRDNTLYENALGNVSNGKGTFIFSGKTNLASVRRALLHFNIGIIPPGSTITAATLRVTVSQNAGTNSFGVHRVLADWGEGASNAPGAEGNGGAAAQNDATWIHRFFGTELFWTTPGGDFVPAASASGSTNTWSSAGLIADVQQWVDNPATNFGWMLKGNETTFPAAYRFDSREGPSARRPTLSITYTPPPGPLGGCCLPGTGACFVTTAGACASQGGAYQGDGTNCTPSPCPPPPTGACCQSGGVCSTLSQFDCDQVGGVYQGDNVSCTPTPCPLTLTPFVDELPIPPVAIPTSGTPGLEATYTIPIRQFQQQLHRDLPPTTVWGYGGMYPGPTIEARRDLPVTVTWVNDLRTPGPGGTLLTTHHLPVDTCLHGPDMTGSIPLHVTHLHGARVGPESDGFPEDAFPPGQQSTPYVYPNNQRSTMLWYHDHSLGLTRLNVYMGVAGAYIIREPAETALNLPSGRYEIPMIIQDRSFNADGSLRYHDMWHDHFFGDFILVNGKVWPTLSVDRGRYRFRIVNGSGSRFYTLALSDGSSFQMIGSDGGLLAAPVTLTSVTIAPGERADLVMDFSNLLAGRSVTLLNSAPAPFPNGDPMHEVPNVMRFTSTGFAGHTAPIPPVLSTIAPIPESAAVREREFMLAQMPAQHMDPKCMMSEHHAEMWAINDLLWEDVTERPRFNTTEVWSWVNRSGFTHPMHVHLVFFQVLDRQAFIPMEGMIMPVGPRIPPPPQEAGWKDTVQSPPGMITRVIMKFEGFTGRYTYHCHILEHEDNEMMRQFIVRPPCPGDANDDGVINFTDITSVLSNFAMTGPIFMFGDATGNGIVNFADVTSVLSNFGTTCN